MPDELDRPHAAEEAEQPTLPKDIRDVQTIKHEGLFVLSDRYGDIDPESPAALGMYFRDTRFLSRWELRIDGVRPLWLHAEADRNYSMLVDATHPIVELTADGKRRTENLQVARQRWLESGMKEEIRFRNFGASPRKLRVEISFEADFRDLFEVRGMERAGRGTHHPPSMDDGEVVLSYDGLDNVRRTLRIAFSLPPDTIDDRKAVWNLAMPPKDEQVLEISVLPSAGDLTPPALGLEELEREYQTWRKRCTRFRVSNDQLQAYLERAILDLRMMTTERDGSLAIDAGVPWFSTLFGRDSLLTAYQALAVNPELAKGTLRQLADLQGTEINEWRDEEPGKILHEVREGEMAAVGEVPHTPYYGSIDSTPLWLIVYGYVWSWTGDRGFVESLWPNALRALEWIDRYGDADGDGFVEYERRSGGGLDNQGWKDSFDGIVDHLGEIPTGPIALCEVQGYVYDAKLHAARVARALGHTDIADELEEQAAKLRDRFNREFWMNDQATFAVALDGEKNQVRSVASNPGHCLWSGIVDRDKALRLGRRLMMPDMMSGWGLRTLSSRNPAFDPIGYHTGSIWPHDNSLIAHGLMLYGLSAESNRVIDDLALAGANFSSFRYPELFCGYARHDVPVPVEYPVACRPQAWATGAPLLMLRSYAGMTADAPNRTLSIVRPNLPAWLDRAEVIGMRVGDARVDLLFVQREGTTGVQVLRKDGELDVVVRY